MSISRKLAIFHFETFFPSLQQALKGKGGGIEMFPFASREYFPALSPLLTTMYALFYFHFPTRQGHLHHLHFVELFLRRTFWFVLMCRYMPLFSPWHTLNIQYHPGVKSINEFRFHENGYGMGFCHWNDRLWMNVSTQILQIHIWLSLRLVLVAFFFLVAKLACTTHVKHFEIQYLYTGKLCNT